MQKQSEGRWSRARDSIHQHGARRQEPVSRAAAGAADGGQRKKKRGEDFTGETLQGRRRAGARARRSNKVRQVQSPGHKPSSRVCCWGAVEAHGLHPTSLRGQLETSGVGKADLSVFVGCPPCEHIHSPNGEKALRGRALVSLLCLWPSAGQLSAQKAVKKQPTRKNNQIKLTAQVRALRLESALRCSSSKTLGWDFGCLPSPSVLSTSLYFHLAFLRSLLCYTCPLERGFQKTGAPAGTEAAHEHDS